MPTPTMDLLSRLKHLSEADQLRWLDEWSRAIQECRTPPKLP